MQYDTDAIKTLMNRPGIAMRGGFSLLELLVVIAIIAMLAAMITPMAGKAIGAGQDAGCKSNLRQLANAFTLYTADHEGIHPIAWGRPGTDAYVPSGMAWYQARWEYQLMPYVKGLDNPEFVDTATRLREMGRGAYWCPSMKFDRPLPLDSGGTLPLPRISYAMNLWLTGTMKGTDPHNRAVWGSAVARRRANLVMLADVVDSPAINVKRHFEPRVMPNQVHYRHGNHANIAYYDGSVRALTREQGLQVSTEPDFAVTKGSLVWLSRQEMVGN